MLLEQYTFINTDWILRYFSSGLQGIWYTGNDFRINASLDYFNQHTLFLIQESIVMRIDLDIGELKWSSLIRKQIRSFAIALLPCDRQHLKNFIMLYNNRNGLVLAI